MTFDKALKALKNGKKIRRSHDCEDMYLVIIGDKIFKVWFGGSVTDDGFENEYNPFSDDLLAEDWDIV